MGNKLNTKFVPCFFELHLQHLFYRTSLNTWLFLKNNDIFCGCKQRRRNQQLNRQQTQKREYNIKKALITT